MPRARLISPEFWTTEAVVDCAPMTRLLLLGLTNFADDFGVLPLRPRTLRCRCFPATRSTTCRARHDRGWRHAAWCAATRPRAWSTSRFWTGRSTSAPAAMRGAAIRRIPPRPWRWRRPPSRPTRQTMANHGKVAKPPPRHRRSRRRPSPSSRARRRTIPTRRPQPAHRQTRRRRLPWRARQQTTAIALRRDLPLAGTASRQRRIRSAAGAARPEDGGRKALLELQSLHPHQSIRNDAEAVELGRQAEDVGRVVQVDVRPLGEIDLRRILVGAQARRQVDAAAPSFRYLSTSALRTCRR